MQRSPGWMQVGGRELLFVFCNIRGRGHMVKRSKVFRHLNSLSADIIIIIIYKERISK